MFILHDVVVLLSGNVVATLDSNIDPQACGGESVYSYHPIADGAYVVQFRDTYQPLEAAANPPTVVAQAEFEVGSDLNGSPVCGVVEPVNTFALVAPWLAVLGLVGCISTVVVVAKKHR